MTLPKLQLDDPDIDLGIPDDGDSTQCQWDEFVCPDAPTHYVVSGEGEGSDTSVFCARHYVLTLAYLVEVHLPQCSGSAREHARAFGSLAGQ